MDLADEEAQEHESLINDADAFIQGLESRSKMFNHTALEDAEAHQRTDDIMGLHVAASAAQHQHRHLGIKSESGHHTEDQKAMIAAMPGSPGPPHHHLSPSTGSDKPLHHQSHHPYAHLGLQG